MTAALTAEGLHTFYGKSHILHGVSLEAAEGKVTALLGRNGAGKTTTLRSLMGLTPPREGQVTIFGTKTTGTPSFSRRRTWRRLCSRRPQDFPQSHRRREPDGATSAAGPVDAGQRLQAVSPARGTQVESRPAALRRRAGNAVDRSRAAAQSQAADARRTVARTGAADRARSVPHRGADALGRNHRAAGRAERAHEPGNRRPRLCARRRPGGLFRPGARACRRRGAGAVAGGRQRRIVEAR